MQLSGYSGLVSPNQALQPTRAKTLARSAELGRWAMAFRTSL